MAEALPGLRELFDILFVAPIASRRWASTTGRSYWVELEGWQDSLAGPLSSIVDTGGCEYVYLRDDCYFAAVNDPPSLRARLLEWHAELAAGVEHFAPTTLAETTDLKFMQSVVRRMREFIERAWVVEQARWQAQRRGKPVAPADSEV